MISAEQFLHRCPQVASAPEGEGAQGDVAVGAARRVGRMADSNGTEDGGTRSDDAAVDHSDPDAVSHGATRYRSPWRRGANLPRSSGKPKPSVENPRDPDACREAALRLLDAAPRSSGELRGRLTDKGYAPETVDDVVLRLTKVKLLDDDAYAWMALRQCVSRMYGRRGAVARLEAKGVVRELAESVAQQADDQGMFAESAWELGRRVAARTEGLDTQVRKRRLWSAGGRKGHNPETLRRIARELFD